MNSHLAGFYGNLNSEANLEQLVQDRREEDLYLEFKQKVDRRDGEMADGDRSAFSKAVSGFANADGGVLVFGIETKKSSDSPDRACSLKPITNTDRFRAKLLDSILNTTQPPVDGVCVETIPSASGAGYIKCLIPASDTVPHRAMLADREYWRRTTNGFRRMEHYELEEVFGRRQRPVLRLKIELRPRVDPDPHEEIYFYFLNEGRGVARHSGFFCEFGEGTVVAIDQSPCLTNASSINANRPNVQYYNAQGVVHSNGILNSLGVAILRRETKGSPLAIKVTWYAENMAHRSLNFDVLPNAPLLVG